MFNWCPVVFVVLITKAGTILPSLHRGRIRAVSQKYLDILNNMAPAVDPLCCSMLSSKFRYITWPINVGQCLTRLSSVRHVSVLRSLFKTKTSFPSYSCSYKCMYSWWVSKVTFIQSSKQANKLKCSDYDLLWGLLTVNTWLLKLNSLSERL